MKKALVALVFLSGCVTIPDHDLSVEATSSDLRTIAHELPAGDWPKCNWWEDLHDATLTRLIEAALEKSPTLKIAEAKLKASAETAKTARAALFPELDFDASTNWEHFSKYGFFRSVAPVVPAALNDLNLALTFHYEFDFWGKYRDLFSAALGEAAAAEAERDQAKLILATTLAYAYTELQFFFFVKDNLDRQYVNLGAIASIRAKRQAHAIDTAFSTLDAQQEALALEAKILGTENEIAQKTHQLKALSGLGQDAHLVFAPQRLTPLKACLPKNLSIDLVARRPDLRAMKERAFAAAKRIGAAKTEFYPNVNLLAFAGFESLTINHLFNAQSFSGSMLPAIHLPIFTAGRLRANLMDKVAEFNIAVEAYNEMILLAAQETADAVTSVLTLDKETQVRFSIFEKAGIEEGMSRRRVDHAVGDRLEFLQAQNKTLREELIWVGVQYGRGLANILLIRALGGGYGY